MRLSIDQYAVTTEGIMLEGRGLDWVVDDVLGKARIEVAPTNSDDQLFVGVGRSGDVDAYLQGVGHETLGPLGQRWRRTTTPDMTQMAGGPPPAPRVRSSSARPRPVAQERRC